MKPDQRARSRPRLAAAVAATVALALLFAIAVRAQLLPAELQYIPPENTLLIAGGRIDQLWPAVEAHFGRSIRDGQKDSIFSDLTDPAKRYQDKNAPVNSLEALGRQGIDTARGFLYSVYRESDSPSEYVLVVPVTDSNKFVDFLRQTSDGGKVATQTIGSGAEQQSVVRVGDKYVARPEAGLAVVASSVTMLERSLLRRDRNLAQARSNDTFFDGARRLVRGRLLRSATTFVFWQPQDVPAIRSAVAALRFDDDAIDVVADFDVTSGSVRVIDDVFEGPPPSEPWTDRLPQSTPLVLAVEDTAIARYLRFLSTFADAGEFMRKNYGGIFAELQHVDGLRRLVTAVTGYHDGVPDILLGIWGEPDAIRARMSGVRRRLQERRDRALLKSVLATVPSDIPISSFANLVADGYLDPEPDSPWGRYALKDREIVKVELRDQDFANAAYVRRANGSTIEYLTPRLTDNDLRYRAEIQPAEYGDAPINYEAYEASVKSDRYRMAYVVGDGVFWLATDVPQLEAVLARPSGTRASLSDSELFHQLSLDQRSSKMRMYVDIDTWIHLGFLTTASGVSDNLRTLFRDLQYQAGVSINLTARRADQARISMRIRRAFEK
jgi:hypothetical protein